MLAGLHRGQERDCGISSYLKFPGVVREPQLLVRVPLRQLSAKIDEAKPVPAGQLCRQGFCDCIDRRHRILNFDFMRALRTAKRPVLLRSMVGRTTWAVDVGPHQMQASAPASSRNTASGYTLKSFMMMTLTLGLLATASGRFRRDNTTTEVKDGLFSHCQRTSEPMKPVAPLKITFILKLIVDGKKMMNQSTRYL
jgi:hypothetical protein